jgi:hypothetical protein
LNLQKKSVGTKESLMGVPSRLSSPPSSILYPQSSPQNSGSGELHYLLFSGKMPG